MKTFAIFAIFLSGCGLGVHGYSASYTAPSSYRGQQQDWETGERPHGTELAVPLSPMNQFGCDPSFQLGLRNRSREHDAVVNIHRLISDGSSQTTTVSVPRGGERIVCLPDVGEYELEVELFAMNLGEPRRVGCYTATQSYSAFVGVAGRHEYWIDDFSARGGRC